MRAEEKGTLSRQKIITAWKAVARETAARISFDMECEPHALFRMMLLVVSRPNLWQAVRAQVQKDD